MDNNGWRGGVRVYIVGHPTCYIGYTRLITSQFKPQLPATLINLIDKANWLNVDLQKKLKAPASPTTTNSNTDIFSAIIPQIIQQLFMR